MPLGRVLSFVAVTAVLIGLGYVGVHAYRNAQPEVCYACKRPIHSHSRTVALVHGDSRRFCCPACALSEERQEGKPVEVKELTAFLTGEKLAPNTSYVVRGSDVNMCARTQELTDSDKRAADVHYDRCSPSLLAFRSRGEAVDFSRQHGGEVLPFPEVAAAFAPAPPLQR